MKTKPKPRMTEAQDRAKDKRLGLKEGSKADLRQDKRDGVKQTGKKR